MRRRARIRIRPAPVIWAPLLVLAGLLVAAGGAVEVYRRHREQVNTAGLLLLALAVLVLIARVRVRRR